MTQLIPATASVAGGFVPAQEQSLIFDGSSYLEANPISVAGGDRQKYIFSTWLYRSRFGTTSHMIFSARVINEARFYFNSSDQLVLNINGAGNNITNAVFRDVGWYHVGFIVNTTEPVSADRIKIMVNGVKQSSTGYQPPLNDATSSFNGPSARHQIGSDALSNPGLHFHGAMSEINFLDGEEMTEQEFFDAFVQDFPFGGGTVVAPINVSGLTYGTDGFRLKFGNTSDFGEDSSGNNNDFTATGFTSTDQITDVPGNPYSILNPLSQSNASNVIGEGGLQVAFGGSYPGNVYGSLGLSEGKYYWETEFLGGTSANNHMVGVGSEEWLNKNVDPSADTTANTHLIMSSGTFRNNGVGTSFGDVFGPGDIIGIALDIDNLEITYYKNNVVVGSAQTLESGVTWFPMHANGSFTALTQTVNYGQKSFTYTPPTGFVELRASNLPTPEYYGGDVFNPLLWTGDGNTGRIFTGVGFQPDFLWGKERSNAQSHVLYDDVRGVTNLLSSNNSNAEATLNNLSSFDVDGFTGGSQVAAFNESGRTYVGWNWKAGGSPVTNNDGTISSQVSVAPEDHFSIVTYTGNGVNRATVGTGLTSVHEVALVKNRDSVVNWGVWHKDLLTENYALNLNSSGAQFNPATDYFGPDVNASGLIGLGTNDETNQNTVDYVMYLFRSVPGLCKVGSYVGNASSDGPYVDLGFKPRWIMIKDISSANEWMIYDTTRDSINPNTLNLRANSSAVEVSNTDVDLISNSFKIKTTSSNVNINGNTYIYLAIAEEAGGGTLPWPLAR